MIHEFSSPTDEQPRELCSPDSAPAVEVLDISDATQHARSLSDADLLEKVESMFHDWRQNLAYIREARDRFAQPGRRLPVEGRPTWTEWVEEHLGVSIRHVRRVLAGDSPHPNKPVLQPPDIMSAGCSDEPETIPAVVEEALLHFDQSAPEAAPPVDILAPEKRSLLPNHATTRSPVAPALARSMPGELKLERAMEEVEQAAKELVAKERAAGGETGLVAVKLKMWFWAIARELGIPVHFAWPY